MFLKVNINDISYILCTHSHGDHVGNVKYLKSLNPVIKIAGSIRYLEFQKSRKDIKVLEGAEDNFDEYNLDVNLMENNSIDSDLQRYNEQV